MSIIKVRMEVFANGVIREVIIPDRVYWNSWDSMTLNEKLESIFYWGQNDEGDMPPVSVGDVILLNGQEYRVESFGFSEKVEGEYVSGKIHSVHDVLCLE